MNNVYKVKCPYCGKEERFIELRNFRCSGCNAKYYILNGKWVKFEKNGKE